MSDIEAACKRLERDLPGLTAETEGEPSWGLDVRTVIAAAREHNESGFVSRSYHYEHVEKLIAERDALKADIERHVEIASREAEARFQAEARAERLETALRKYGEHYEGCHGGHRCHCGLSAALGEKP